MPSPTDILPSPEEVTQRLRALPAWALREAETIVYPDCPTDFPLYPLPSRLKPYLVVTIGEALVRAKHGAPVDGAP